MLREKSVVDIVDNSGALKVGLFSVTGKNGRRSAGVGAIVRGSVKRASTNGKVAKGEVVSILITATKRKITRKDGSSIRFSKNCGIVVNKGSKEPIGTRLFAPIAREIKDLGFSKVVSMAPEVL
jgi:large subunit ribosomal protein L14